MSKTTWKDCDIYKSSKGLAASACSQAGGTNNGTRSGPTSWSRQRPNNKMC